MQQSDVPKVDSVNLSTRIDEINWTSTILDLYERQGVESEKKVKVPVVAYSQLLYGLEYEICQYIHIN